MVIGFGGVFNVELCIPSGMVGYTICCTKQIAWRGFLGEVVQSPSCEYDSMIV